MNATSTSFVVCSFSVNLNMHMHTHTHTHARTYTHTQVSMMEVYNESIYDLLVPPSEGHVKLQIHKKGKEVVVPVSLQHNSQSDWLPYSQLAVK